ncbi:hypothetical protein GYA25_01530 [Candidatus Woesearchaeota archaeon]|nr:hypothetical protein [Candidatus Woesearchaeota archaeon]
MELSEFGFSPFSGEKYFLPNSPLFLENNLIGYEKNFGDIVEAILMQRPFNVIVGLRPDIKMHLGYRFLADMVNYFSEEGGEIYLVNPKNEKLLQENPIGIEEVKDTVFYNNLRKKDTIKIVEDMVTKKSEEILLDMASIYSADQLIKRFGILGSDSVNKIWSLLIATSSYFIPNLNKEADLPTLVIGNPSHATLVVLANDYAHKRERKRISAIFPKMVPGIDGSAKMSISRPSSNIWMDEPFEKQLQEMALYDVNNPEDCPLYSVMKFFIPKKELSALENLCVSDRNCENCKIKFLNYLV